jgi:hypothetical protein
MPLRFCPRFDACSANDCPLDPNAALHGGPCAALAGEMRCRATRSVRERIALAHGYDRHWALLPGEERPAGRRAGWAGMTPDARARRLAGLRKAPGRPLMPSSNGASAPMAVSGRAVAIPVPWTEIGA